MPTIAAPVPETKYICGSDNSRAFRFDDYQQLIVKFRKDEYSDPIHIRFPWQTKIAISELLYLAIDLAKKQKYSDVRLLTSSFPWEIYGPPVADLIVEFLKSGGRFRLLVWNDGILRSQKLVETLQQAARGTDNFQIRYSNTIENGEQLSHMLVIGKTAYRLEAPHKSIDESAISEFAPIVPARVCFNDKSGAAELGGFFDDLWNLCAS